MIENRIFLVESVMHVIFQDSLMYRIESSKEQYLFEI